LNNSVTAKSFHNAPSPVYIVNGAAGDKEGTEPGFVPLDPIRAYGRELFNTGYARMYVNRTAVVWDYVDTTKKREIVDRFTLSKDPVE